MDVRDEALCPCDLFDDDLFEVFTALSAMVRRSDGTSTTISMYKQELEDGVSEHPYLLLVPEPESGWRTVEVPGLLAAHAF